MIEFALGDRWSRPQPFEEQARILGVSVELAGFSAHDQAGKLATGSAASLDGSASDRAYFELLERTSIVDAIASGSSALNAIDDEGSPRGTVPLARVFPPSESASYRYAISNGVAVASSAEEACDRARLELVERDRVLASWYGHAFPEAIGRDLGLPASWKEAFEFRLIRFPPWRQVTTAEVAGLVALPFDRTHPFACGFGAGSDLDQAVDHAVRECVQVLGFLWGEPLPAAAPELETSPDFHQAMYLFRDHHQRIRAWLDGEHARTRAHFDLDEPRGQRVYVDLTPRHLRGRLWVVKAMPDGELPLVFGMGHPNLDPRIAKDFPAHPIA